MRQWILAAMSLVAAGSIGGASQAQSQGDHPWGDRGGLRQACSTDIAKLCAGVEPGGGRIMQCMRQHRDELSDGCKSVLASMRAHRHQPHDATEGSPPGETAPPMSPPGGGNAAQ